LLKTARVAVDGALYHFDREYTYLVPESMASTLRPGCRVRVTFGAGNLRRQGMVLQVLEEELPDSHRVKPILEQLDETPLLNEEGLMLLRYLKEQTFCTWFDGVRLLVPAGLGIVFKTLYAATGKKGAELSGRQQEIVDYVKKAKAPVGEERLTIGFGLEGNELEELVALGVLEKLEQSSRKLLDEKVTMVRLLDGWEDLKLTPKQKKAAQFLAEHESVSLRELCYYTGVTRSVAEALQSKGAVDFYDHVVFRNPYGDVKPEQTSAVTLNEMQQRAFETLSAMLEHPEKPALLYGVTGSGKTQVYLSLIEQCLRMGKTAMVLVPEISLTAQTLETFHSRFGSQVAVLHSGLSLGERMDEWRRIKEGHAQIVLGTRSAVFAPVRNLGLLVIDEEQEHTYQSDKTPRFHARDIARLRCRYHRALLLLASATPSVESYHAAQTGRYELVELGQRYGSQPLPQVEIVDMRQAENLSDTPSLSLLLREELLYNLEQGQQSILLLNRRGHSTLVRCSTCGEVAGCPSCSVSLTYHAANDALLCHYCGYQTPRIARCPSCGSEMIRLSGAGTQRLEEELKEVFPEARVLRVDMDTTMSKFSHEKLFAAFAAGEYDIMIGTQMVAKGLNFPNVTLVGVLNTDQSLYNSDFRSFERTFSLLTQVVGRCGRGKLGGRAVIQTYSPENPIIELAAAQDYKTFYQEEILSRKLHLYPPFCTMVGIGFSGTEQSAAFKAANAFLEQFRSVAAASYRDLPLRMLGPVPADVFKAAGRYRYKLLLKCNNNSRTRALLHTMLEWFYTTQKQVSIFVDMHYDGN